MLCCRLHYAWDGRRPREIGHRHHTPGEWALCAAVQPAYGPLRWLLLAAGVLSADEDGGLLYWQWPWRPSIFRRHAIAYLLGELFERPFCHVCLRPKRRLMLIATDSRNDEDLKPFDLCRNRRCPEGPRVVRSLGESK